MKNRLSAALAALALALLPLALLPLASPALAAGSKAKPQQQRPAAKSAAKAKAAPKAKSASAAKTPARAAASTARKSAPRIAQKSQVQHQASGPGLRISTRRKARSVVRLAPPVPSFGELYGLRATDDELDLKSSVALVVDQETDEVLFSKNPDAVLPIASITKLMTALVVTEADLSLDEPLTVTQDDVNATLGSKSRLALGTQLTRGEMLHLALMASENRAAHLLGRTYPGGLGKFVGAMNSKAHELGMSDTRYVEPTGLSSNNQSSAQDLTRLVRAAFEHPIIRELSTSLEAVLSVGEKPTQFRNTNGLVRNPEWEIGLQKTGYISAAGRCVVMQAQLAGRKLIMVLLDSAGRYSRIGDAERLRTWLTSALVPEAKAAEPLQSQAPR